METPIQIAIDKIDERLEMLRYSRQKSAELKDSKSHHRAHGSINALIEIRQTLTELLPTEKEQIEQAWNSAYGGDSNLDAEQYYTQTFKVNQ